MWTLAIYLVDRGGRGAEWTQEYEQPHHAETKARHVIEHGFGYKEDDATYLYHPAHKVDYVAIRKHQD